LSQITHLTDGQTDGQTDRMLIARPRLHSMQRGNKTGQSVKRHCDEVPLKRCITK